MANFQINAGHISRPRVVGSGQIVTVTPDSGATAIVEFTSGSMADIQNNAAVWKRWPKGGVTVATSDMVNNAGFIRVTAVGGNVPYAVDDEPSSVNLSTYRPDWGSSDGVLGVFEQGGFILSDSSTILSGDSTMQYGNSTTTGASSISHVQWCNDYMRAADGVGFDVIGMVAVGGATVDDLIALQLPAILASPAQVSWTRAVVNNFNSTLGHNDPLPVILAKVKTFLDAVSAAKKLVIFDFVNPVSQSGSTSAKPRAGEFRAWNNRLVQLGARYPNVIINNTYESMVDPASEALNPLPNMLRTDDGIHFVSNGAQNSGYASFRNISPRVRLSRYKVKGTNILPEILGTGGTITGGGFVAVSGSGVGVGWEVLGVSGASATHTLVISDVAPNKKRLTFTNTGASAATTYIRVSGLHTQLSTGMTVQGGFGFVAQNLTGLNRLTCTLRESGVATWDAMAQNTGFEPTTIYPQSQHTGFRVTPPKVLPALSNYEFIININVGALTGAAQIDIELPELCPLY